MKILHPFIAGLYFLSVKPAVVFKSAVQCFCKCFIGRIDAVITMPTTVYVIELKYNKTAREALEQIDSKGYLVPYRAGDKRVVKVGLNYSPDERTINDWQTEKG